MFRKPGKQPRVLNFKEKSSKEEGDDVSNVFMIMTPRFDSYDIC